MEKREDLDYFFLFYFHHLLSLSLHLAFGNNVAEFELGFLCFVLFVFGGFNLGGWNQISAGNIIAIVSTLLYTGCACYWLSCGGPLGAVMPVDIGALLNPTLTFENPVPSTHWPPNNPVWVCTIMRVRVIC